MHAHKPSVEPLIGLIRVSTGKQAESGLGLEGQEHSLEAYRASINGRFIKIYKEIESGTHADIEDRPQLRAAVSHALLANATLVVAKIDRLVRSTVIMAYLERSRVKFVACDNPNVNNMTIKILVVVAEDEARRIAARTKDALAAYRRDGRVSKRIREVYRAQGLDVPPEVIEARGGKLGGHLPECRPLSPEAIAKGRAKSAKVRSALAVERYSHLVEFIKELRSKGMSYQAIAEALNADGHRTRGDHPWNGTQVNRVLGRLPKD